MTAPTVLVVGAGPVGTTAALALSRAGLDVTVVDAAAAPNREPRAAVYLHSLLPDLDRLGILGDMKARGHVDREGFNLHLVALDEVLSASFDVIDGLTPTPFNIHLGQGEYTAIVTELLGQGGVAVRWNAPVVELEQSDTGVDVEIRTSAGRERLHADWVVGADGGRSAVRHLVGQHLEGFTWDERFVATNLQGDLRPLGFRSSNLYIHPTHACVVADIDGRGLWRCTFQEDGDLPESELPARIRDFYDELFGSDAGLELVDYRPYRMHQRMVGSLRSGRVVLIGDAAHLTNPTGGLGLTTGLYDVLALEEVLPAVAFGRAPDDALDRWAADRARVFSEMSSPRATALKRLVFGRLSADALREETAPQREMLSSEEGRVAMLMGLGDLRSPSLLAGRGS